MNTKDLILFGAITTILEEEFGIDVEAELDLSDKSKEAIVEAFDNNVLFALEDDNGFIKEELIKILKEIVDKID